MDVEQKIRGIEMSVTELAECVKDLVRIMELKMKLQIGDPMERRLNGIYKKASEAKNRMDV